MRQNNNTNLISNPLLEELKNFFPSLGDEINLIERTFKPINKFPHKNIYTEYNTEENGNRTGDIRSYNIEYALSGFSKDDITIELNHDSSYSYISIYGKIEDKVEDDKKHYHLKNISTRSFQEKLPIPFKTDEKNISANMENGILKLNIKPVESFNSKHKISIS